MSKTGYTKTAEIKILRVKHKVTFRVGARPLDLIERLKTLPDHAEVDEVVFDYDKNIASIEFHEEKVEL